MLNHGVGNLILSSLSTAGIIDNRGTFTKSKRWMSLSTAGISLTTAANLPPASLGTRGKYTTCVTVISANLGKGVTAGVSRRYQRRRWSIFCQCCFHRWCTLNCEYLRESSKNFEQGARERYDFLTEKYRNQTQMLPQPRFMLFRVVSSASLIRYPSTFKHSPSKLPGHIPLVLPLSLLNNSASFWYPFLLFANAIHILSYQSIALLSYTSAFKAIHNYQTQFKM